MRQKRDLSGASRKVELSFAEAFGRLSQTFYGWGEEVKSMMMVAVFFHKNPTHVQDWSLVGTSYEPSRRPVGGDAIGAAGTRLLI